MGIDKEGCNHVIIGNGLQEKFSGSSYNKGMGTVVVVSRTPTQQTGIGCSL